MQENKNITAGRRKKDWKAVGYQDLRMCEQKVPLIGWYFDRSVPPEDNVSSTRDEA